LPIIFLGTAADGNRARLAVRHCVNYVRQLNFLSFSRKENRRGWHGICVPFGFGIEQREKLAGCNAWRIQTESRENREKTA
jgi:hypothetical protein